MDPKTQKKPHNHPGNFTAPLDEKRPEMLSRCLLFLKFKKPLKQPPPAYMTNESPTAQTSDSFHLSDTKEK